MYNIVMSSVMDDLKKSYEKNLVLEIQNQILRREHLLENRKLLKKVRKSLEETINNDGAGSPEADRMVRVMRTLEDMVATGEKDLIDVDEQYKELIELMKSRYPEEVERARSELERELKLEGYLDESQDGIRD